MKILLFLLFGAFTGFLNGFFGGGGGMIIVPILLWLNHAPVKKAHATALLIILPVSIISGLFYLNLDGFDWSLFWQVGVGVLAGGVLGALLLKKASNHFVAILFALVMLGAGVKLLFF